MPHKKIYHALKDIKTHYVELKNMEGETIPWREITLRSKETKKLFNNRDKEITTRIAHQGYKWGDFYYKMGFHQNSYTKKLIQSCKFCKIGPDNVIHLILECPVTNRIWKSIENLLNQYKLLKRKIDKDVILYNHFRTPQIQNIPILIDLVTAKTEIINQKEMLDAKNQFNWNNEKFLDHILWVINTKLKDYLEESSAKNESNSSLIIYL